MNFKNTIIILTSNLGAEYLQKAALDSSRGGEGEEEEAAVGKNNRSTKKSKTSEGETNGNAGGGKGRLSDETRQQVMSVVRKHFRPEFLNRYVLYSSSISMH